MSSLSNNAPSDDRRRLVADVARERDIDYVTEPRPGLSWARNRRDRGPDGEVVAWADDDAVCDRLVAGRLARGFVEAPGAGAAPGLSFPVNSISEPGMV